MKKLVITASFALLGVVALAQEAATSTENTRSVTPKVTETQASASDHHSPKGKSCCAKGEMKSCHGKTAEAKQGGPANATEPKPQMGQVKSESPSAN